MVRWKRFRAGLVLSSVLWVACDLNPQPIAPGDAFVGPGSGGTGAAAAAGSRGTVVSPPVIGTGGSESASGGMGNAPSSDPDAGVDNETDTAGEGGSPGGAGGEPGGAGAGSNEGGAPSSDGGTTSNEGGASSAP